MDQFQVFPPQHLKIGLALQYNIALALATKPSDGRITSSFGPTLFEIKLKCNALVALLSGTQNLTLHIFLFYLKNYLKDYHE